MQQISSNELIKLNLPQRLTEIQVRQHRDRSLTIPPILFDRIQEHLPWEYQITERGKVVNLKTAKLRLIDKPFLTTPKYKEQQGRAVREHCHPEIIEFEGALVRELKNNGMPFFCHSMFRTTQEQQALFDQGEGVTTLQGGDSAHNYGCAADIIHSHLPWDLADTDQEQKLCWSIVGHIGFEVAKKLKIKVEWGGDWRKPWDPAHWQLADWRERTHVA